MGAASKKSVGAAHIIHWHEKPNKAPEPTPPPLNRITHGWSNYYHYGNCSRVFGHQQRWVQNRLRWWLWRKYDCKHGHFSFFNDARLFGQYQLWPFPLSCAWRR